MNITTERQECFDTRDPFQLEELRNEDAIYFQRITEKRACNGFSCDLKRKCETWVAKFDDVKSEIGFENVCEFAASEHILDIQNALIEGVELSKDDKRWIKKLHRAIKRNAVHFERD